MTLFGGAAVTGTLGEPRIIGASIRRPRSCEPAKIHELTPTEKNTIRMCCEIGSRDGAALALGIPLVSLRAILVGIETAVGFPVWERTNRGFLPTDRARAEFELPELDPVKVKAAAASRAAARVRRKEAAAEAAADAAADAAEAKAQRKAKAASSPSSPASAKTAKTKVAKVKVAKPAKPVKTKARRKTAKTKTAKVKARRKAAAKTKPVEAKPVQPDASPEVGTLFERVASVLGRDVAAKVESRVIDVLVDSIAGSIPVSSPRSS